MTTTLKWLPHDGGECPVPPETMVYVKYPTVTPSTATLAYRLLWKHGLDPLSMPITHYAIADQATGDTPRTEAELFQEHWGGQHIGAEFSRKLERELTAALTENARLKAIFRVNMIRAYPKISHEEIDASMPDKTGGV